MASHVLYNPYEFYKLQVVISSIYVEIKDFSK